MKLSPDSSQSEGTYPQVVHMGIGYPQGDGPQDNDSALSTGGYPPPLQQQEPKSLEPTSKPSRNAPSDDAPDVLHPTGAKIHRGRVPDRWPYLLDKLAQADELWDKVTIGGLVQIARATSVEAVSYALSVASDSPPTLETSAYGWITATARAKFVEGFA